MTTKTRSANRLPHGDGVIGLLSTMLASGQPRLADAACVGNSELFDATNGSHDDIERAQRICAACGCLSACAAWASRQRHLVGVVAGKYHQPHRYDREQDDEHDGADEPRRAMIDAHDTQDTPDDTASRSARGGQSDDGKHDHGGF